LHSLSGTVSQALKIHGPNYGVGGGSQAAAEALIAAGALLADEEVPGVWVVLTGFEPELVPAEHNAANTTPASPDCVAVALALRPARQHHQGPLLSIAAMSTAGVGGDEWPRFGLEAFANMLDGNMSSSQWSLPGGGWAAWQYTESAVEICT
jgi:hypothetical protein